MAKPNNRFSPLIIMLVSNYFILSRDFLYAYAPFFGSRYKPPFNYHLKAGLRDSGLYLHISRTQPQRFMQL